MDVKGEGEGRLEGIGKCEGRGNYNQNILYEKRAYFQEKKKIMD